MAGIGMIIDYHTHHGRCGHAVGSIEDYIIRGMEIGVHQLGVSDHMPLFHIKPLTHCSGLAMGREELPGYVEEVLRLKEKYRGDIDIRLGIEADYVEGYEDVISRILRDYPWDYIIGSVHYLGSWDLYDSREQHRWKERPSEDIYRDYYRAVALAAHSGLFDIIGHLDGINRYGSAAFGGEWMLQQQALDAVAEAGIAIELNTSGLRHPCRTVYPAYSLVEACKKRGIPMTIGSDAHHPRQVAAGYDEAAELLQRAGIRQAAVFANRVRDMVPLSTFLLVGE
jgi:histidinol-phosphatase (PHP family)